MKRSLIVLSVAAMITSSAAAGERILTGSFPADGLERVVIDAGVGDLDLRAGGDDSVGVEVTLKARRGGFFSSKRRAERQVEQAVLRGEVVGRELHLEIDVDADERRFEERWRLEIPARLAVELDMGVGDVEVHDTAGGVEIEVGVGDVMVVVAGGDVIIELGVGNATVTAPANAFARVTSSSGVGDGRLTVRGDRIESDGFVGHSTSWTGAGPDRLEVEVGVGDSRVTLE